MSAPKITAGPWTACFAHDGKGTIFSWHVTGSPHGSTHPVCGLASVSPMLRSYDEDRANAMLIAAAPDLYEACDLIEQVVAPSGLRHGNKELNDAIRKVRAALKKAEGQQ